MNKKIKVLAPNGSIKCFVLSSEKDYEKQIEKLLNIDGHGICVVMDEKTVKVRDYYCDETMGTYEILSVEDSEGDAAPALISL